MDQRTAAEREHIAIMQAVASDLASLPLALKGGTALLLCYGLDRFSEDIDLDGRKKLNLQSRLGAVLSNVTTEHDIRIVKDTDTVQRIKIRYKTPVATGNLKIEVSYRTGFDEVDLAEINGIKTYKIPRLIEQKLRALEGRTTARDLYDVAFLAERYSASFSPNARADAKRIVSDLNTLESRFRPAFEADDIFSGHTNVDEVILRLQSALERVPTEREMRMGALQQTRTNVKTPDHGRDR